MALAKKTTSSGRKATTISRYNRKKDKRAQPQPSELSLAFKTVKKSSTKAHKKRASYGEHEVQTKSPPQQCAKDTTGTTTAAIDKILLAEHEIHIAWQKKELARAEKTAARRQAKLTNSGFVNSKGQRIYPTVRKSFTIKVEEGSGDTKDSLATLLDLPELRNDNKEANQVRKRGPDLGKTFDKNYPAVAEMVVNKILDERDEVGSLTDFVDDDDVYFTADEGLGNGDESIGH